MTILVVHPGFTYSTLAVAESYFRAFNKRGYECVDYDMLEAVAVATKGLKEIGEEQNLSKITEMASAPILNMVLQYQIDYVFVIHGGYMNVSIVNSIRMVGCKCVLILTDDPMQVDVSSQYGKYYDHVFTNDRRTIKKHQKNCSFLPVAADDSIFKVQEVDEKYRSDILIAGSFYKERMEFIEENLKDSLLNHQTKFVGPRKRDFKDNRLNDLFVGGKISYEEMALYTSGAKFVIDIPRDEFACRVFGDSNKSHIRASCISPRVFECGLTKTHIMTGAERSDSEKLFKNPVPKYDEPEEINGYIEVLFGSYPNLNCDTINKFHEEVKKNHTYDNRIDTIEGMLSISPSKKGILVGDKTIEKIDNCLENDWRENFEWCKSNDIYKDSRSIQYLKDTGNGDIHIVSNGPSLNIKYFEDNRETSKHMICLNGALIELLQREILPIYCCAIHPKDDLYERCFSDKLLNNYKGYINWLFSTVTNKKVIFKCATLSGSMVFFNTTENEGIKKEVFECTKYPKLGAGYTVGYSAIACAIYMGYKNIHIHGLDFCYLNNQKYYKQSLDIGMIRESTDLVPTRKGGVVLTDRIMIKSKNQVLKLIEENSEINFFVYGDGLIFNDKLKNLHNKDKEM